MSGPVESVKVKNWDALSEEEKASGKWVRLNRKQRKAGEAIQRRMNKHRREVVQTMQIMEEKKDKSNE